MNFIPPANFSDEASPVQYVPRGDATSGTNGSPRVRRKKSFTSLWNRKQSVDDVPSLPRTPTASTTPSFDEHGTHGGFSVNQTDSLDYVAHAGPAVSATKELIVSGVSFMDLSDSSGDEEYQRSILLHRLRRAISKTDLTTPESKPSAASPVPSSPGTDIPGFRRHARCLTDVKDSASLRISTYTDSSSAELTSIRSATSCQSPLSPHSEPNLSLRACGNPPLDPDFEFNEFMTSNKPQVVHALRSDMPGLSRKLSKNAPPIDMPRSRRYETISIQATRESIHGYASFLSRAKTHGLPMPDMIEEDEGEWNRAVKWVRDQEAKRVVREANAARVNNRLQKSVEARQAQKEADWNNKIGLARQFIRRTSAAWSPRRDCEELYTDEAGRDTIAEALDLASKHHTLDPGFTELRKRFFAGRTNQFSGSADGAISKSAPLPRRPGWMSPDATGRNSQYLPTPARSSTTRISQQTFPECPVSPVGSSPFESPQSPLPALPQPKFLVEQINCNALGIEMEPPDPEKPDMTPDSCGLFPSTPGPSPLSQRNAFSSSREPRRGLQRLNGVHQSSSVSSTSVIGNNDSYSQFQSSAEATLANARIFKVDRDSKIKDRWAPKRCSTLYQTIDAARELAEARMGISPTSTSSTSFPQGDSLLDVPSPSIKKVHSAPPGRNMLKRAAKYPALRAMVSSMSMRSPDATEMVPSPVTPTSNHPAYRYGTSSPSTPAMTEHRPKTAPRFNSAKTNSRASTSSAIDDPVPTPISVTNSDPSSQKSSAFTVATGEERWAQRIRQKLKVEQTWQHHGMISAPAQQPDADLTSDLLGACSGQLVLMEAAQQRIVQTPSPPELVPSESVARSSSSQAMGQLSSPHLSRKTQDSPTPLHIKKFSPNPTVQHGLSLPVSPAPLHVTKTRAHPAVRRVLEQSLADAAKSQHLTSSFDSDNDPFAKPGSNSKAEEDWPLSDVSTNNAANEDHQHLVRSPLDGHFDRIITSWRHASATQDSLHPDPPLPTSADDAGKHEYIRSHLELDVLQGPAAGKTHPEHPYHWETTNVMCKDIHNSNRNSGDTSSTGDGDDSVRFCSFCQETCCYFGQQLGRANIKTRGRDQSLEELKNQARSHVYFLRGTCPEGIEDYQVLLKCGLCERICCPGCADTCQYPLCSEPVCKECVELEIGLCGQH